MERDLPIPADVRDACGLLGLDPLYVANEGKLIAFVPREDAALVLEAMHGNPLSVGAAVIGECVAEHRHNGGGAYGIGRQSGSGSAGR